MNQSKVKNILYSEAVRDATDQMMEMNPDVFIIGLGVPDPKGIFGTTLDLKEKYGENRVLDMPASENTMTGVVIGSALTGLRPIITHQRFDFALLAFDQIINNAAKWHYMFGGKMKMPLVIRLIIGRGWGQGPQHSQSLHALFTHIPGLKVLMPVTPYDAKGLLISAIEDDNPVIFIEHRWLHRTYGEVPNDIYRVPIGKANVIKRGQDISIVSNSYMTIEALRAAEILLRDGIKAEVVDVRTLKPIDSDTILRSIEKTKRLLVADGGWRTMGFASEILALTAENLHNELIAKPKRVTYPDMPTPTSIALTEKYYPRAFNIVNAVREIFELNMQTEQEMGLEKMFSHDVPDDSFMGPF